MRPLAGQPAAPTLLGGLRLVAASYASFHSNPYPVDLSMSKGNDCLPHQAWAKSVRRIDLQGVAEHPKTDLESGLLLSRSASDEICRKISQNFSPAGVASPFVARAMPMAAARTSCRSAGERAGVCQPHLGPVYLRVSAACLPNFFKSRSNVSRSFFERTLATSSIAAACSPNPRLISARPLGVSSTLRTRRSSG